MLVKLNKKRVVFILIGKKFKVTLLIDKKNLISFQFTPPTSGIFSFTYGNNSGSGY
jgi:hypothetical protein